MNVIIVVLLTINAIIVFIVAVDVKNHFFCDSYSIHNFKENLSTNRYLSFSWLPFFSTPDHYSQSDPPRRKEQIKNEKEEEEDEEEEKEDGSAGVTPQRSTHACSEGQRNSAVAGPE